MNTFHSYESTNKDTRRHEANNYEEINISKILDTKCFFILCWSWMILFSFYVVCGNGYNPFMASEVGLLGQDFTRSQKIHILQRWWVTAAIPAASKATIICHIRGHSHNHRSSLATAKGSIAVAIVAHGVRRGEFGLLLKASS